jgi:hypothetical protein
MNSNGTKISAAENFRYGLIGFAAMMGIFVALLFGVRWLLGCDEAPKPKTADEIRAEFRENVKAVLQVNLRQVLKDPDSAKYSDLVLYRDQIGDDDFAGHYSLCGYVNAKNGFGGYSGPQGFVSSALFKKGDDKSGPLSALPTIAMDDPIDLAASETYSTEAVQFCKDATPSK